MNERICTRATTLYRLSQTEPTIRLYPPPPYSPLSSTFHTPRIQSIADIKLSRITRKKTHITICPIINKVGDAPADVCVCVCAFNTFVGGLVGSSFAQRLIALHTYRCVLRCWALAAYMLTGAPARSLLIFGDISMNGEG